MLQQLKGGVILAGGIRKALGSRCQCELQVPENRSACIDDFQGQRQEEGKCRASRRETSVRRYSRCPLALLKMMQSFSRHFALETLFLPNFYFKITD